MQPCNIEAIALLVDEAKANSGHNIIVDHQHSEDLVRVFLSSPDKILLILWDGPHPIGFLAGVFGDVHPIRGYVSWAANMSWYVTPKHRGRGIELFNQFEQWAEAKGAQFVMTGGNDRLEPFYTRRDYSKTEIMFTKEITSGN